MKMEMSSWVENIGPDDEVEVEFIYPEKYVEYNLSTIKTYASGIAHICKGSALLGNLSEEFLAWDMTVLQALMIVKAMKSFGIELCYCAGQTKEKRQYIYFFADLEGLRERLERGEFDVV